MIYSANKFKTSKQLREYKKADTQKNWRVRLFNPYGHTVITTKKQSTYDNNYPIKAFVKPLHRIWIITFTHSTRFFATISRWDQLRLSHEDYVISKTRSRQQKRIQLVSRHMSGWKITARLYMLKEDAQPMNRIGFKKVNSRFKFLCVTKLSRNVKRCIYRASLNKN